MAQGEELPLLLKGQVGENEAVDADLLTGGDEALGPIGEDHIGIGHKDHGDRHVLAEGADQVEDLIGGDTPWRARRLAPG